MAKVTIFTQGENVMLETSENKTDTVKVLELALKQAKENQLKEQKMLKAQNIKPVTPPKKEGEKAKAKAATGAAKS